MKAMKVVVVLAGAKVAKAESVMVWRMKRMDDSSRAAKINSTRMRHLHRHTKAREQ